MKIIIASGPVILSENKLLVSKDDKDDFYKIPGGRVEEGESLEETCIREGKEETGLDFDIVKKLSTMILDKNPQTDEEMKIELHHYLVKVKNPINSYEPYETPGNYLKWLPLEEIKQGKHNVAPNIKFLIEKGDI